MKMHLLKEKQNLNKILFILEKYATFLNTFTDFIELSTSLSMLISIIRKINIDSLDDDRKIFILNYIKALIEDLQDWKEHVFVLQDAIDIFYINASSLANCMQLENYLKKISDE